MGIVTCAGASNKENNLKSFIDFIRQGINKTLFLSLSDEIQIMKTNLTSPRYRSTFDVSHRGDMTLVRVGIIRLSPGQWVTNDGGKTKGRFVRLDKAGNPWIVWSTKTKNLKIACNAWLGR